MKFIQRVSLSVFFALSLQVNAAHASDFSDNKEVKLFIQKMNKKHHFNKEYLQKLFDQAKIYNSILEAIARPAESKPWYEYRPIFVTPDRTKGGVKFWKKNAAALKRAAKIYGVPEEIIVAIIGVETRYGKHAGRFPVFDALATLAFAYPPRASFFKGELEQFLLMASEENIPPREFMGSYAGAMGMPQFISSSFRQYAIDFNHDGKRDLWKTPADAIGSVANYFKKHHWKAGEPITSRVKVHGKRYTRLLNDDLKPRNTPQELLDNGVILPGNITGNLQGTLLEFATGKKPEYWVGWNNFYVITRYNHSALYSMAVYQLSQEIKRLYLGSS